MSDKGSFCTAINCMDGRVQLPVINYLLEKLGVDYVDSITEPGPIRILADNEKKPIVESIINRVNTSIVKHGSEYCAVVGHYDCAGNPVGKEEQLVHIEKSIAMLKEKFPNTKFQGIWVDENWDVHEV